MAQVRESSTRVTIEGYTSVGRYFMCIALSVGCALLFNANRTLFFPIVFLPALILAWTWESSIVFDIERREIILSRRLSFTHRPPRPILADWIALFEVDSYETYYGGGTRSYPAQQRMMYTLTAVMDCPSRERNTMVNGTLDEVAAAVRAVRAMGIKTIEGPAMASRRADLQTLADIAGERGGLGMPR